METTDLTTTILQNIRDDIAKLDVRLNGRIDKLDERIEKLEKLESRFDKLDSRFDKLEGRFDKLEIKVNELDVSLTQVRMNMQHVVTRGELSGSIVILHERMDRLQAQLVESNLRATTAHQELQATLDQIMTHLAGHGSLHVRVDRCEQDIADLKERVL